MTLCLTRELCVKITQRLSRLEDPPFHLFLCTKRLIFYIGLVQFTLRMVLIKLSVTIRPISCKASVILNVCLRSFKVKEEKKKTFN